MEGESIFAAALGKAPGAERQAFLDEACGGDKASAVASSCFFSPVRAAPHCGPRGYSLRPSAGRPRQFVPQLVGQFPGPLTGSDRSGFCAADCCTFPRQTTVTRIRASGPCTNQAARDVAPRCATWMQCQSPLENLPDKFLTGRNDSHDALYASILKSEQRVRPPKRILSNPRLL
jgi:hypothetical protein